MFLIFNSCLRESDEQSIGQRTHQSSFSSAFLFSFVLKILSLLKAKEVDRHQTGNKQDLMNAALK